jgi:hypothetical protein
VKGLAEKVLLLIGVLGVGKTTVLIKTVEALKRTLRINTGNHTQKQPLSKTQEAPTPTASPQPVASWQTLTFVLPGIPIIAAIALVGALMVIMLRKRP